MPEPSTAPISSLAGPLTTHLPEPRDVALPDFTSDTYVSVNVTLTGAIDAAANWGTIWAPRESRFVLRGGYLFVLCYLPCNGPLGAGVVADSVLSLYDEAAPSLVLPITSYKNTTPAGWVNDIVPWHFDLGKGYRSKLKNNRLRVGGTVGIGTGQIWVTGLVWGVQDSL